MWLVYPAAAGESADQYPILLMDDDLQHRPLPLAQVLAANEILLRECTSDLSTSCYRQWVEADQAGNLEDTAPPLLQQSVATTPRLPRRRTAAATTLEEMKPLMVTHARMV